MVNPRHIWAGDWRTESERAREAAERAERLKSESRANAAQTAPLAAGEPDLDHDAEASDDLGWRPRRGTLAVVLLAVLGLIGGAFAVGTLTGGNDDSTSAL